MSHSEGSGSVWGSIYARLQFYDRDHLRQFFAAAAKFLIDPRCWDDRHPGTDFDHRPEVQAFHAGFEQLSAAQMRASTALDAEVAAFRRLLIDASGFHGKGLNRRVAKRKLGDLRDRVRRAFRDSRESQRGLRVYEDVIRSTYLRTEVQVRRSEARKAVDRVKSPSPAKATLPETRRRTAG
jgi:hypothetical protein